MVKGGFRVGSENHKDRGEEFGLYGERDRLLKYGRIILIKSKDERSTDGNPKSMKGLNDFPVLRRIILKFLGGHQVPLRKRLEADEETDASALRQQFHIFDLLQTG